MQTECNAEPMRFARLDRRDLVADFGGGAISSDAGALLLAATDRAIGLVERFAGCFRDGRDPGRVAHALPTMVGQRVLGIALGYEDLIDHDELRRDPVLGAVLGQLEAKRPGLAPLAGKSTLNRLEHAPTGADRYRRIGHDGAAIEGLFVDLFLEAHDRPPARITLDLDATDDPIHGQQEGRFFHGYYDCYCYLPLYIFCGDHLLAAKLRRADIDASAGSVEEIARIVGRIRAAWPGVKVLLRADSGFAREALMPGRRRTGSSISSAWRATPGWSPTSPPSSPGRRRRPPAPAAPPGAFADFAWTTRTSWSRPRRVVAKAEWLPGREDGANPCFVVTSLPTAEIGARALFERLYCARGDMENRIKECQLDLFADRTSAATMRANQLRLWFASMAYVLVSALRRRALGPTRLARACCGTIRAKLLTPRRSSARRLQAERYSFVSPRPRHARSSAPARHRHRPGCRLHNLSFFLTRRTLGPRRPACLPSPLGPISRSTGSPDMSPYENTLTTHRWVRIMCDYCADGVWDRDGAGCSLDDLPASPALLQRIRDWQDLFEGKDSEELVIEWEHGRRFTDEGLAIAKAVKAELPDWTVVYFDEAASEEATNTTEAPRAVFEYEICATDAETHAARLAAAVEQLGLVAGETRIREGDVDGVFVEALDVQRGRLWIAVLTDGHRRELRGDWEKVG